ncbi:MAG: class II aldolase/adducin family protein [Acidobacteria bacterium]|nr:class II aldolase/adducin family protein [Acidobacteriota bacterium]
MTHGDPAAEIAEAMRFLGERGLNHGSAGNVSVRTPDGFLISASAIRWDRMTPQDVVLVSASGATQPGPAPSSEWRLHASLYRSRSVFGSIVHTHSPWATSLAVLRLPLPPIHYSIALSGMNEVPCAPYATFGTEELGEWVVRTIGSGFACLLANHGLISAGESLEQALDLAVEIENLSRVYLQSLSAGEPLTLTDDEMDRARGRFDERRNAASRKD